MEAGVETGSGMTTAAFIAHELRTPLATQRALLELALADCDADAAAWREIGRDVLDACRQQERLLDACLALGRSRVGLLAAREKIDIAGLAAELLESADLGDRTATARFEPALTSGIPGLIERLLDNLLANAVRHNRAGGWIAVGAGSTGTHALFTIENSGRRIPAGALARLFEPFERLASSDAHAAGGLGLGLAVVKAVADAHGASVGARARPGGGLRVEVAFPSA